MKSPTEIEWENPKIVRSVRMSTARILMNNNFIIAAHHGRADITCDVYLMWKPQRKQKSIILPVARPQLLFQDGILLMVTHEGEIKYSVIKLISYWNVIIWWFRIVDVATSNSRIIANLGLDFSISERSNFLRYVMLNCSYASERNFGCSLARQVFRYLDFLVTTVSTVV